MLGEPGNFLEPVNRHDYALDPFGHTVLDSLKENGNDVIRCWEKLTTSLVDKELLKLSARRAIWMGWINY